MLSLSKIALFSLISFAALAFAIPAPETRQVNAKTLLTNANNQVVQTILPVGCVNSNNATAGLVGPILANVTYIVNGLVTDLQGASFDGCTSQEILGLVATLLNEILGPLGVACGQNSGLLTLVGGLVSAIVELVQVVLGLVGVLVAELLVLLIGNGCAGIIRDLGLGPLIDCLGLGNLLGSLL